MMRIIELIALTALLLPFALGDSAAATGSVRQFIHGATHCFYPYMVNYGSSPREMIQSVGDLGFRTVHINFCAPYNGGNIDTSSLDESLKLIAAKNSKAVIYVNPRFLETEGMSDTLNDGRTIVNIWDKCPNAFMVDVFNKSQRARFADYVLRITRKYAKDPRVAGFLISWGYMGETGLWIGDFLTDSGLWGTENSGYSPSALAEFNNWRRGHKLPRLDTLPLPSTDRQSRDYVLFHRFRCEYISDVFHAQLIAATKKTTSKPVGMYCYTTINAGSFARDWTKSPGADFLRSGGCCASPDMPITIIESGVGVEDTNLSDGSRPANADTLIRDMARQIARGNAILYMYIPSLDKAPWEPGTNAKLSDWIRTKSASVAAQVKRGKATVALYQPTWGSAALPSASKKNIFLPDFPYQESLAKNMGLAESCGITYEFVSESDLLQPSKLWKRYDKLILPMWGDCLKLALGDELYAAYEADRRVARLPLARQTLTRSEFKALVAKANIACRMDYDSEKILVGMHQNMVYNLDNAPHEVTIDGKKHSLAANSWEFVDTP